MNKLTRAQAWYLISEKLLTKRTVLMGLCREVVSLYIYDRISFSTRQQMLQQITGHLNGRMYAYRPGTNHKARAMAAFWLALEAADEECVLVGCNVDLFDLGVR